MLGNRIKWVVAVAIALSFMFGMDAFAKSRKRPEPKKEEVKVPLCNKCETMPTLMNIGECSACKGESESGSYKLCRACATKKGVCMRCEAALDGKKDEKIADAPKPKTMLCEECAGKSHTKDMGECTECKAMTTSGEFKLCMGCAAKKNVCMCCQKALPKEEKAPVAKSLLCKKCEGKSFIKNIGTCSECPAMTTSGSHKFCMGCAEKKNVCMHCGAKLEEEKAAAVEKKEEPAKDAKKKAAPKVDVVFVLDTTGSMSGLIAGAKQKIWSIANNIISGKPTPEVRIGLIAYRDKGDAYITQLFPLTNDIDKVFADLQSFKADGGGDGPESVNQALNEAVTKMEWTPGDKALKMIFLVGDYPPHMDYKEDVKYPDTCKEAVKNWIVINTVRCGNNGETEKIWQEISKLADGNYVSVEQGGGAVVIKTPVDEKLAELGRKLDKTVVVFGKAAEQKEMKDKMEKAADKADDAAPAAAAERAEFRSKAAKAAPASKARGGFAKRDLLNDLESGEKKLEDIKEDEMPLEMQKMNKEEQKKYIAEKQAERKKILKEMEELSKQRAEYIKKEMEKLAAEGKKDSFDEKVFDSIKEKGAKKGIEYEKK